MIKRYLFTLLHFFTFLNVEGNDISISSNDLSYYKEAMSLEGNVVLEHDLGIIKADQAELFSKNFEKGNVETITLKKDISVHFSDGGKLSCGEAEVNIPLLEGSFHNNVEYSENSKNLKVKSQHMTVYLKNLKNEGKNRPQCIQKIKANDEVVVEYNEDFIAYGDYGFYDRKENECEKNSKLNGLLSLQSLEGLGICKVTNKNKDQITASIISIDTLSGLLAFLNPKGVLHIARSDHPVENIEFSADNMIWSDKENTLLLRGNCVVDHKGIGKVISQDELILKQHKVEGKTQIQKVISKGKTLLIHQDDNIKLTHTLTSFGVLEVNHEHLQTVVMSPRDENHNVLEGKQVFFQDNFGKIYADKLLIFYEILEHTPQPTKLVLEGNVKVIDESKEHEKADCHFQYAFTDKLEYDFATKEAYLSSNNKKRVLFFDKINNLQISAPAIKIKRDEALKKESIQGIGDVRFSFIEAEKSVLKHYFPESNL